MWRSRGRAAQVARLRGGLLPPAQRPHGPARPPRASAAGPNGALSLSFSSPSHAWGPPADAG